MDPVMFPNAVAYLAALPGGFAAHPQCLVKGSVVRDILATDFATELRGSLPPELVDWYTNRPVATSWVPEVHLQSLLLAIFDRFFAKRAGAEGAFLRWVLDSNRVLFSTPLYRVLFFVVTPERLFVSVDKRWNTFRRGSKLETVIVEPGHARLRITHPSGLYNDLLGKVRATAFRAAAECAGATHMQVALENRTAFETEFSLRWM